MGRNQHSKDRLFVTPTERKMFYGGKVKDTGKRVHYGKLPYDHCAISLTPFEDPLCTKEGHVFDVTHILPYIKKHKRNPCNGAALTSKDLVPLKFHQNAEGKNTCPVLFKEFSEHSTICMIWTSGNVFSYEAVQELNLKTKHFTDLLTGEKFTKKDVVMIQDPKNPGNREITNFKHMKEDRKRADVLKKSNMVKSAQHINANSMGATTNKIFQAIDDKRKRKREEDLSKAKAMADKKSLKVLKAGLKSSVDSSGHVPASFTASFHDPITKTEMRDLTDDECMDVRHKAIRAQKKKGYVTLNTSMGRIDVELHFDMVPRTCENFLELCKRKYYDGLSFHRVIGGFMAQGGDPTGTGKGGDSIWGKPFKDEFDSRLKHSERGVLAMANAGSNTNRSQFYFIFRSCEHLDLKHTVFGRMVAGDEVLRRIEQVETDEKQRPKKDVLIVDTNVIADPAAEYDALQEARSQGVETPEEKSARLKKEQDEWMLHVFNETGADDALGLDTGPSNVGKYLKAAEPTKSKKSLKSASSKSNAKEAASPIDAASFAVPAKVVASNPYKPKPVKSGKTTFGNFSGW